MKEVQSIFLVLSSVTAISEAAKREGFVKFGTSFAPDIKRVTGKR